MTPLPPGTRLGPYVIQEYVGHGATAAVYKGDDTLLRRTVALKVLRSDVLNDPTFAERFEREARIWASLEHSSIVPIYSGGVDQGRAYLSMKFIAGGTLAERLKQGALNLQETILILREVASALDYAHSIGVVHRDVKPANVLLATDGRAYLTDFGIARLAASGLPTQTAEVMGTPTYMAPEQARNQAADYRVDIYSLGCMTYEMITGIPPFRGENVLDVLMRHITDEPAPLRAAVPNLEPHAEQAVLKAMSKDPAQRWPTAQLFVQALRGGFIAEGVHTLSLRQSSASTLQTDVDTLSTPKLRAGARWISGVLLVLAGVGAWMWWSLRAPAIPVVISASPIPTAQTSEVGATVERLMERGAYPEARQMVELALSLDPENTDLKLLRQRIQRAWDAERSLGVWSEGK